MPATLTARTVRSADGTTISYHTTGTGPDLIVVPGAMSEAADFATLADALLALYEPGVSVQGLIPMDWIPQYRQFLAQGRPLDAFAIFSISTGPSAARRNPRWLVAAILRLVFRGEKRADPDDEGRRPQVLIF